MQSDGGSKFGDGKPRLGIGWFGHTGTRGSCFSRSNYVKWRTSMDQLRT